MNAAIIEKLSKILSLANDHAAAEGEVQSALARAKEIALKHGIDLASVPVGVTAKSNGPTIEVTTEQSLKTSSTYEHPYHNWVMRTLEETLGVQFLLWRSRIGSHPYLRQIYIIGETTDVAMAMTLFPWLEKMFPKAYWQAVRAGKVCKNFSAQNGYYLGLFQGIVDQNKREEEKLSQEDRSKWALVLVTKKDLVQQEFNKYHKPNPKQKVKQSRKQYDSHAQLEGWIKGKTINLSQMGGRGQANSLPTM